MRHCLFGSIRPQQHEPRSFGRGLAISGHRTIGISGLRREPRGLMEGKSPAPHPLCGIKPNRIVSDDRKRNRLESLSLTPSAQRNSGRCILGRGITLGLNGEFLRVAFCTHLDAAPCRDSRDSCVAIRVIHRVHTTVFGLGRSSRKPPPRAIPRFRTPVGKPRHAAHRGAADSPSDSPGFPPSDVNTHASDGW